MLNAIDQVSEKLREVLGEPISSVRGFDRSLTSVTSSLEALHAYELGWKTIEGRGKYLKTDSPSIYTSLRDQTLEAYSKSAIPFSRKPYAGILISHWPIRRLQNAIGIYAGLYLRAKTPYELTH